MKTYIQEGKSLLWTNDTGDAVSSGDVVVIGSSLGVAAVDIADEASGTVTMVGVFTAPKTSGSAITQGDPCVWDVSAGAFVPSSTDAEEGDITGAAICWADAASAATSVSVKLTGPGAVTAASS